VQIDYGQIPSGRQKLRTSGVLVKEGGEFLRISTRWKESGIIRFNSRLCSTCGYCNPKKFFKRSLSLTILINKKQLFCQ
jgi:hypothetical protein